jgi:hypothetical protein
LVGPVERGDFSTDDAPRPGRPKAGIIVEIHELILENSLILAKLKAEQLT